MSSNNLLLFSAEDLVEILSSDEQVNVIGGNGILRGVLKAVGNSLVKRLWKGSIQDPGSHDISDCVCNDPSCNIDS